MQVFPRLFILLKSVEGGQPKKKVVIVRRTGGGDHAFPAHFKGAPGYHQETGAGGVRWHADQVVKIEPMKAAMAEFRRGGAWPLAYSLGTPPDNLIGYMGMGRHPLVIQPRVMAKLIGQGGRHTGDLSDAVLEGILEDLRNPVAVFEPDVSQDEVAQTGDKQPGLVVMTDKKDTMGRTVMVVIHPNFPAGRDDAQLENRIASIYGRNSNGYFLHNVDRAPTMGRGHGNLFYVDPVKYAAWKSELGLRKGFDQVEDNPDPDDFR